MNREKEIFEELFVRYPALASIREDIKRAYDVMCTCYDRGGKLLILRLGYGALSLSGSAILPRRDVGFLGVRGFTARSLRAQVLAAV